MAKKNKIGILTFHDAVNYGAVLQAYALQRTLYELGVDSEIINYHKRKASEIAPDLWFKQGRQILLGKARKMVMYFPERKRKQKFKEFIDNYLVVTDKNYYSSEELEKIGDEYDAYIVGSDQVWNPRLTFSDETYFLNFVKLDKKKYSYAASIGISDMKEDEFSVMIDYLRKFNAISVRESEAKAMLEGKVEKSVNVNLDPTFLLKKEQWLDLAKHQNDKGYILVYALQGSRSIYNFANILAKRKKLSIKVITLGMRRDLEAEYIKSVGPQEFLGLFANAKYVVTNSFHGLAFSINMQLDFFVELLNGNGKPNSRLNNILSSLELEDRIISNEMCESIDRSIDYSAVERKIDKERMVAIEYLRDISMELSKESGKKGR